MIYTFGGMKYSLGKTRSAVNFALYLSRVKERDVLLIDGDPSECATEYIQWRNNQNSSNRLATVKINGESLKSEVLKLKDKFDDIVIDSGVGEHLEYSMHITDRLIVPFNGKDLGLWTVWTLTNIETLINKSLDLNPNLKAYSFFVKKPNAEQEDKQIIKALKQSQFLTYLESSQVHQMMTGEEKNAMRSLKDFKHYKNDELKDLFEDESR